MEDMLSIDEKLARFAESIPAKGMHTMYLSKAVELYDLWGKALMIAEEDETPEGWKQLDSIAKEMDEIIG